VIAGDEQLWAGKLKPTEAGFQRIAIEAGGIADNQQRIAAGAIHLIDQVVCERTRLGVVIVQIGGDEQTHDNNVIIGLRKETMHPLVVEGVSKSFRLGNRDVTALAGVTLDVAQGSFLAIMGASGSGKSTLLHLMAGLTLPDQGKVLINGTSLGGMNDRALTLFRRRNIGLVFQSFNLIPTLSAEQNVRLPLMLDGTNGQETDNKVNKLLSDLGLDERRRHRPDALSGGEQQRVAIGRALISDPTVILADEPTGNLDSVNSRSVCELLQNLSQQQGKTIVMVTHEPSIAAYAQRIVVLKDGKLVTQFATAGANSEILAVKYQEALRTAV
jgi:putative ABC transport system ATP-binding protein